MECKNSAQTGINKIIPQIKRYSIRVTAVQETTWQGEAIIDLKTHTLLQTGQNTGIRGFGVSFTVDSRCKENILGFQPIN
jgi:hypothetical protein